MKTTGVESAQSEPTVFGAVRRYRVMVLVVALAGHGGRHRVFARTNEDLPCLR